MEQDLTIKSGRYMKVTGDIVYEVLGYSPSGKVLYKILGNTLFDENLIRTLNVSGMKYFLDNVTTYIGPLKKRKVLND